MHSFRSILLLPLFGLVAADLPAQNQPETFFAVHCEPNNANPQVFQGLRALVADAEARNIPLSFEFGVTWAEMILANPTMLAEVRAWQQSGHAVGGHHHGVDHPYWDGYTDLHPSQVNRIEPVLGTMADFKAILDPLVGPQGLQFGGLDDSEYEWPYGVPFQTHGGRDPDDAVTPREFWLRNHYSTWHVDHAYLDSPIMLANLKSLHDQTQSPNVFGVVTHVVDYQANPAIFQSWFDFLQAKDPTGSNQKTVMEILAGLPPALVADRSTLPMSGGQIQLSLRSDATLAGMSYRFLLSLSGSFPGYDWNGIYDDGVHVGLNPDSWTDFSMEQANSAWLPGFFGITGVDGGAAATVDTLGPLPPSFSGQRLTFAAVIFDAGGLQFSSNPVEIDVQ
ncbi:MAG: hypothetical protein DWQ01_06005 [Planctomycetota bacterium]|nr:MAG: hypothetical protein DWQ01_06005 [Planctomycetota bacterium]